MTDPALASGASPHALLGAVRLRARGILLAATIAAAAVFLSEHYGAPSMLFALLIGMAFNFLAEDPACKPGIQFASTTLLRIGVALLGLRLSLADMAELGLVPVAGVVGLVTLTILTGLAIAPLLGRAWRFGLLTGGAVAICGASAALAIAAILPKTDQSERDTLFTVIGVTALSTIAMIAYPIIFRLLGFTDTEAGFLIGATIHDVAQVVGAGYSISDTAGDIATFVKLQRVALLPVVLIAVLLLTRGSGGGGSVKLPWFVVAFVVLVLVNSTGFIPPPVGALTSDVSRYLLVIAIAGLGVKTSLKTMIEVGPRHAVVIVGETLVLLAGAVAFALLTF